MKKLVLFFGCSLVFFSCKKDKEIGEAKSISFEKTIGTAGSDELKDVDFSNSRNGVWAGYTNGMGAGGFDGWVVCTNEEGTVKWQQTFGGTGDDFLLSVLYTPDNNYLLTGYSSSGSAGMEDVWLLKIDAAGTLLWEKRYGGSLADLGIQSAALHDGSGFLVSATTQSKGAGLLDHWVLHVDSNGELIADRTFGDNTIQGYASLFSKGNGNFFLCGRTDKNGSADIDVIEINSSLDSLSEFIFGSADYEEPKNIVALGDGTFMLGGHSAGFGNPEHNFYAVRFTAAGAVVWQNNYGSTQHDGAENIFKLPENKFLLTGRSNGNMGNAEDMLCVIIDADGNELRKIYAGGTGNDQGNAAKPGMGGTVYTAGKKEVSAGNADGWMMARKPEDF